MADQVYKTRDKSLLRSRAYSPAPRYLVRVSERFHHDLTYEERAMEEKFGLTYAKYKVKTSRLKWTGLDRLMDCYSEVNRRLLQKVISEFQSYVRIGQAPGEPTYHKQPAIAEGNLINAPQLEKGKEPTEWLIKVASKVWLFQEYGFNMEGKMPTRRVAERILQWALKKGIVEISNNDDYSNAKFQIRKEATPRKRARNYRTFTEEEYQTFEFEGGDMKKLDSIMWALTAAVVKNADGEQNRRLFLTTAYKNIMENPSVVKEVELDCLKKYGFR